MTFLIRLCEQFLNKTHTFLRFMSKIEFELFCLPGEHFYLVAFPSDIQDTVFKIAFPIFKNDVACSNWV